MQTSIIKQTPASSRLAARFVGYVRSRARSVLRILRKWGPRALARLPLGSELVGPPRGLYRSSHEWVARTSRGGMPVNELYQEIYPETTGTKPAPGSLDGAIPWQFLAFYGGQRYTDLPGYVLTIPRGRVVGEGGVISADDRLIGDVSREHIPGGDQGAHSVFSRWKLPGVRREKGTIAVLAAQAGDVYWHWMFDVLPRVHLIQRSRHELASVDKFVVNELRHDFQKETLEALGISASRLLQVRRNGFHVKADTLLAPSVTMDIPPRWACDYLRSELLPKLVSGRPGTAERIYVSRSDANTRRVVNEPALVEMLGNYGFTQVTLTGKPIAEQAALFSGAQIIIAPHGSGLTNLLYCRRGTIVIELFAPAYVNPCYWALCAALGLDYNFEVGFGPAPPSPPPEADHKQWFFRYMNMDKQNHDDMRIDPTRVEALLNQILTRNDPHKPTVRYGTQ